MTTYKYKKQLIFIRKSYNKSSFKFFMKVLKYLYLVFILIIFVLAFIFIKNNFSEFDEVIDSVSLFDFVVLSILTLITTLLNGNKIEILTKYYGLRLKFKEWFGLSVITTMSNYLAPFGLGMSLRGLYLKRKYKFPYGTFITTLATSYLTSFLIYSFLGLLVMILVYFKYNFFNIILLLLFLITFLVCISVILFSPKINYKKKNFLSKVLGVINNWNKIKRNYKLLIKLTFNDLLSLLNYSFRIFFIFYILSNKIPFISSVLISVLTLFSSIIGLTPASIGVKEALIIYSTIAIGKSLNLGIAVAAIDRIIAAIYVFSLGGIFSYILLRNLKNRNNL